MTVKRLRDLASTTPCWITDVAPNSSGYSYKRVNGTKLPYHRYLYQLFMGPVPSALQLDHLCRNRWCVNPDHLEPVTRRENILRGISFSAINARKKECPHGHSYEEESVNVQLYKQRICRTCKAEANVRYRRSREGSSVNHYQAKTTSDAPRVLRDGFGEARTLP